MQLVVRLVEILYRHESNCQGYAVGGNQLYREREGPFEGDEFRHGGRRRGPSHGRRGVPVMMGGGGSQSWEEGVTAMGETLFLEEGTVPVMRVEPIQ